jgi:asparagine synthase (glutamine-hydrolysing)
MTARMVGFRWRPTDRNGEREARARLERLGPSFSKVSERRGVLIALAGIDGDSRILPDDLGVVLGPLFLSGEERDEPVTSITSVDAWKLAESGGERLVQNYWGGYCAVLHDHGRDELHLLRDPCGAGALYVYDAGEFTVFANDAEDLLAANPDLDVDDTMLSAFLCQPRLVTARTGLANVREVLPGVALTLMRAGAREAMLWQASVREPKLDFVRGQAALRRAVERAASAWVRYSQNRGPIALRLSGGFDSTLVACALHHAGARDVMCFNEFPADTPEGDERAFARIAAETLNFSLRELAAHPDKVSYPAILDARLSAKPSYSHFSFSDSLLGEAISMAGARIVASGQGGDQVLHRSRTASIAADAMLDGRPVSDVWRIALDTAHLIRAPVWDVFAAMAGALAPWRQFSPYNSVFENDLASNGSSPAKIEWEAHPWMREMHKATPARALRMTHVADLHFYHQASSLSGFVPAPLLASQPVVECALSIAPYDMTRGGGERALARAAFADWIPREILERRHKGDTTRYHRAVLERQLPFIREMLCEGELMKRGQLARDRVHAALAQDVLVDAKTKSEIMTAFIAELWLRRLLQAKAACARASHGTAPSCEMGSGLQSR